MLLTHPGLLPSPADLNLLNFGEVDPSARRVLGFCEVQGTAGAGMSAGELQEQQTTGVCRGRGVVSRLFYLPDAF